jgi:hypothetical protein
MQRRIRAAKRQTLASSGSAMTIQPIDLQSLVGALAWPLVVAAVLWAYRGSAADMVRFASGRVKKVSFAGFELELAKMTNVTPPALEVELRQIAGAAPVPSGTTNISQMYSSLLSGGRMGYVVVDLGSDAKPEWLASRVYLFAYLIDLIDTSIAMVFVEDSAETRRRFIGVANPADVRGRSRDGSG